jgi:hypothetical protein
MHRIVCWEEQVPPCYVIGVELEKLFMYMKTLQSASHSYNTFTRLPQ